MYPNRNAEDGVAIWLSNLLRRVTVRGQNAQSRRTSDSNTAFAGLCTSEWSARDATK